jgi:hypothetical protein
MSRPVPRAGPGALFGDLIEGPWEQTREEFHQNMRSHVDSGRIAHGWDHAASGQIITRLAKSVLLESSSF